MDAERYTPDGFTAEEWQGAIDAAAAREVPGTLPAPSGGIYGLRDGKCYVYFIASATGPIKIGFSNAPYERLARLQNAHWDKLEIAAKVEGDVALERDYHSRFADHRLVGEWFSRCPDIQEEIARLNKSSSYKGNDI